MASPPSIAIIGAGPAGLTLARLLQVCAAEEDVSLNITIFERDTSPTSRTLQGGTLDLHPATGLAAIKACKLWDEFLVHARYEGEELVFADKNGTEFVHMKEATQIDGVDARPEIDRERLKTLLLESVEPSWVTWGKHLMSVTESGMLHFDDNTSAGPFDLIVGAEGAWSKIRAMVTDVRPTYSGVAGILCSVPKPNEEHPALSKLAGRGSYFVFSDAKAIMIQRMGDESLKISIWMKQDGPETPAKLIAECGPNEKELKEKILEHYQDWVPEITQFVEVSTRFQAWPLYELPIDHEWEHKKGFTLMGDAAHLMTPFAGEGVNAAMKDALELSGAIIASQKTQVSLDTAVRLFEEDMFPRMHRVQRKTMRNRTAMFRADAPTGLMLSFIDMVAEETGRDLTKGLWYYVIPPVRGLAFCYFWTLSTFGKLRRRLRSFWSRS